MKNTQNFAIRSLLILITLAAFQIAASAQDGRERVKFAKGATSAVLTRTLSGDSGVITFIATARKGQRMHFTIESDVAVTADLSEEGKQDFTLRTEANEPNEFIVKKTGNHYIAVVNPTPKNAKITLRISIK